MRAGAPYLVAVEHPLIAIENGRGPRRGGVGTCLRFADRDRKLRVAGKKRLEVAALLLRRSMTGDVGRGEHRGHDARRGIEAELANRLAEQGKHDWISGTAPILLVDE